MVKTNAYFSFNFCLMSTCKRKKWFGYAWGLIDIHVVNPCIIYTIAEEEESLEEKTTDHVIPPHNSAAKVLSQVYNIRDS